MPERFVEKFLKALWENLRPGGRDIGETIRSSINFMPRFYIRIGNLSIPVTSAMISLIASVVILTILGLWLRRGLKKYEITGKQALVEKLYLGVIGLGEGAGMSREQAETALPWTLTMGLYIFMSNAIAIAEFPAAAMNPAVPLSLALFSLVFIIAMGIHLMGFKHFGYSLIDPIPMLLPFNVLDYLIKPVSLALRLFGNVFGAYILLGFVKTVIPLILPSILGLWFDVADGLIQGLIFMYLTTTYLGEVVEKSENTAERLAQKNEIIQHKKVQV
ncbi:MAG TPA: FoF1 ATP synthase subunit a [Clostridia bacterium]|nr:FoF1 ATP synthase subunit a [Clostridia bacterium]